MSLATLPTTLDFDQLRAALPYAYPWILIDRVIELEPGKRIVALKNVSGNEWMFPGHFPGRAIYPGVLLVESMAQASILLLSASPTKPEGRFLLAGSRVRFLRVVVPGDQLLIHCSVDKNAEQCRRDLSRSHNRPTSRRQSNAQPLIWRGPIDQRLL